MADFSLNSDTSSRSIESIRQEQERLSSKISNLRLEQSRALAEYEARKEEQNSRGIFKKIGGFFTGKNKELKQEIETSYERAQAAGREIQRLLEQSNYLQSEANRVEHMRTAHTVKNIATEVLETTRDTRDSSYKIDNLENQMKKIALEIDKIDGRLVEKITGLEDRHVSILKLVDNVSKSIDSVSKNAMDISNNVSKNHEQFISLQEQTDDSFQKMSDMIEHQGNDIHQLQKKVEELFGIFKELFNTLAENNKIVAQHGENIAGLSVSLQQEIEHGLKTDSKFISLDEINMNQNLINNKQDKTNECHELQLHHHKQLLIACLIIGSFGTVTGVILAVFKFILKL